MFKGVTMETYTCFWHFTQAQTMKIIAVYVDGRPVIDSNFLKYSNVPYKDHIQVIKRILSFDRQIPHLLNPCSVKQTIISLVAPMYLSGRQRSMVEKTSAVREGIMSKMRPGLLLKIC